MKKVLISIQPYWVFLIISKKMGWNINQEKTVEVRKNHPKSNDWNKVVKIYCTKDKKSFAKIPKEYQPLMAQLLGKIIGEFVCNQIDTYDDDTIHAFSREDHSKWNDFDLYNACIHSEDLEHYANDNWLYGWHISNLVIYDEPRELAKFKTFCKDYYDGNHCDECKYFIDGRGYEYDESDCGCNGLKPIERPPQSWCYVESEVDSE